MEGRRSVCANGCRFLLQISSFEAHNFLYLIINSITLSLIFTNSSFSVILQKCGFSLEPSRNIASEAAFTPDGQYIISGNIQVLFHATFKGYSDAY